MCWASTSSAPGPEILGVELAVVDRVERGAGFEIFEAVAGDDRRLRSARRAGGWRGRCAAAGATIPWARPSGRRGRRRPSRCRGRGWRSRRGRAACPPPSPPRPCAAPPARGCRDGCRSAAPCRSPPTGPGRSARRGCACCRRRASSCAARSAPSPRARHGGRNGRPRECGSSGIRIDEVRLGARIAGDDVDQRPCRHRERASCDRRRGR